MTRGMVLIGDYACEGSQCYFGANSIDGIPGTSELLGRIKT